MIESLILFMTYLSFLTGGKFSLSSLLLMTFFPLLLAPAFLFLRARFSIHFLTLFLTLFFFLALGFSLPSPYPLKSLAFSFHFLLGALSLMLLPESLRRVSEDKIKILLLFPLALACIYGFVQYQALGIKEYLLFSFYFNPNVFAGLLILAIPFVFHQSLTEKKKGERFLYLVTLTLSLFALFMTQSRGAIIALLLACLFSLLQSRAFLKFLLPFSLLLIFFAFFHPLGKSKWNLTRLLSDRSFLFRSLVFKSTLHAIARKPLGYGTFSFGHLYPRIKKGGMSTLMAHNTYLQIAFEWGFAGFFFFLWFCFYLLFKYPLPYRLSILGFLLHNLLDYTFYFPAHLLLLFFFCVLAEKEKKTPFFLSLSQEKSKFLIPFFLFLTLPALFLYLHFSRLEEADFAFDLKKYRYSQSLLQDLPLFSCSYDALMLSGKNMLFLENYNAALKNFQKAHQLDPEDPEALFYLGITYLHLNQPSRALAFLKNAHQKKPSDLLILKELSLTYLKTGYLQEARKTLSLLLKTAQHPYNQDRYAPLPGMVKKELITESARVLKTLDAFEKIRKGKNEMEK